MVTFWQKNMIIQHWSYVFYPPPLKTHQFMEAFVSKPLGRFWIEHLSVLFFFSPVLLENNLKKNDSRLETIFVRHEIYFQTYFWAFFENEWKGQITILSSKRKKYVFILRKFECSIFLYQQYYASSNVSTISQPPPTQFAATFSQ